MARVGDESVSWEAFFTIYNLKVRKYVERGRTIPAPADRRYRRSIAQRLVRHVLLAREFAAHGMTDDHDALAERMARAKEGIEDWDLHLVRRGETEQTLRSMFVAELRQQALLERRPLVAPPRERIEQEYERMNDRGRARHPRVMLSTLKIARAQGKAAARRLRALAAAPEADFAALARDHTRAEARVSGWTSGPSRASWLDDEQASAIATLAVGGVSRLIATDEGWRVIRLDFRWPEGVEFTPGDGAHRIVEARVSNDMFFEELTNKHRVEWFINVDDPSRPARPTEPTAPRADLSAPPPDADPTRVAPAGTVALAPPVRTR